MLPRLSAVALFRLLLLVVIVVLLAVVIHPRKIAQRRFNDCPAIAAAQRAVAQQLKEARGRHCSNQSAAALPWFVDRPGVVPENWGIRRVGKSQIRTANGNFGDELNVDFGAVLLGKRRGPCCTDSPSRRCWNEPGQLAITFNRSHRGKVLAIGSSLQIAQAGDVVYGAGYKPFRNGGRNVTAHQAWREIRLLGAVSGPRSCERLADSRARCLDQRFGDPALAAPFLLPSWCSLRWRPSRCEVAVLWRVTRAYSRE